MIWQSREVIVSISQKSIGNVFPEQQRQISVQVKSSQSFFLIQFRAKVVFVGLEFEKSSKNAFGGRMSSRLPSQSLFNSYSHFFVVVVVVVVPLFGLFASLHSGVVSYSQKLCHFVGFKSCATVDRRTSVRQS